MMFYSFGLILINPLIELALVYNIYALVLDQIINFYAIMIPPFYVNVNHIKPISYTKP